MEAQPEYGANGLSSVSSTGGKFWWPKFKDECEV